MPFHKRLICAFTVFICALHKTHPATIYTPINQDFHQYYHGKYFWNAGYIPQKNSRDQKEHHGAMPGTQWGAA